MALNLSKNPLNIQARRTVQIRVPGRGRNAGTEQRILLDPGQHTDVSKMGKPSQLRKSNIPFLYRNGCITEWVDPIK